MSDPNEMPTVARDSDSVRGFLVARFDGGVEMGPDLPQGTWSRAYAFRHASSVRRENSVNRIRCPDGASLAS